MALCLTVDFDKTTSGKRRPRKAIAALAQEHIQGCDLHVSLFKGSILSNILLGHWLFTFLTSGSGISLGALCATIQPDREARSLAIRFSSVQLHRAKKLVVNDELVSSECLSSQLSSVSIFDSFAFDGMVELYGMSTTSCLHVLQRDCKHTRLHHITRKRSSIV